jgi:acyl dehydratase
VIVIKAKVMSDTFDPEDHCPAPHRGFDQLVEGEKFVLPSRTVTDAHFSAFQMLSADNHPIHYDRVYCENQGHRDLLAHGLQVLCFTAAGAGAFPHVVGKSLIGFIELTVKFKKGVYVNDTLYPCLQITELQAQNTTGVAVMRATVHNQAGDLVLEGQHKYLLRLSS